MFLLNWKLKKLAVVFGVLVLVFMVASPVRFSHEASVSIPEVSPNLVWEYVADFSNMIRLNPTIVDFSILSEEGNYDHWQYSVQYTENLSHWPHLVNEATASFSVRGNWRTQQYRIDSVHRTCFFFGLYCLYSDSRFQFSKLIAEGAGKNGTFCEESVNYGCPLIMSSFCRREVDYQRRAIMKNLHNHFISTKSD